MKRCEIISKYYQDICNICNSLTDDWEDLAHDICEYFLTCKADIVEIEARGKFKPYVCTTAFRHYRKYMIKDSAAWLDVLDLSDEEIDIDQIIKGLSDKDLKILTIFATGASISSVSQKVFIDRHTLKKHLKIAQKNAKELFNDL